MHSGRSKLNSSVSVQNIFLDHTYLPKAQFVFYRSQREKELNEKMPIFKIFHAY